MDLSRTTIPKVPDRPRGVIILAVLEFFKVPQLLHFGVNSLDEVVEVALIALLFGVLSLVVGRSLLFLQRWAYQTAFLLTLLSLLSFVYLTIFDPWYVEGGVFYCPISVPYLCAIPWAVLMGYFAVILLLGFAIGVSLEVILLILIAYQTLILSYLIQPRVRTVFGITRFLR